MASCNYNRCYSSDGLIACSYVACPKPRPVACSANKNPRLALLLVLADVFSQREKKVEEETKKERREYIK